MSKKKKDITVEQLAVIADRLTEAVDLLKIISTQTRPKRIEAMINPVAPVSKQLVEEYHNDPQMKVVRENIDSELLKSISDEKERYHAYRDKPLQPYVRVHEAP
ncbi:hypothetical protein SEA_ATKINBUA_40 [Mycobacterium phage Atkinbua]|nr:hypothetical protein SEA_BRITON15_40 [Mycobacterium phage Briton15]QHB38399.1 hypothetical protein SEA_ATKINBUA_40 [Mycobacterium phage Atkinbua]WNM66705.1 hypothetical protein SEA_PASCALRANGO_39 [Mycobacterium phage PascalRango]